MRILLFSTLYPSAARPNHGLFVEMRLRQLRAHHPDVQARVVAPVPWFPSTAARFGEYASFAATPRCEQRHGIELDHPRYPLLPKVGMSSAPLLMALGALPTLKRQADSFDLIDAHYVYPDGVAAALLARWLGKPWVVTARGTDLNLIARYRMPAAQIRWALGGAAAGIGVSAPLAHRLRECGAPADRVHVLRNGVDGELFAPVADARTALGGPLEGPWLLTVGNLVPLKRQALAIQALALLRRQHPGARLRIVGAGPERPRLEALASSEGVGDAVRFVGAVPQAELAREYSAADAMLLPSEREGWPNVVLESLACGTPVVGAHVGGVPEILTDPILGRTVEEPSAQAWADAVVQVLARSAPRQALRAHALTQGWQATSDGQRRLFEDVLARHRARPRGHRHD
jgi:teichuronic acid biosynthesis glycosyltransferase TuaC